MQPLLRLTVLLLILSVPSNVLSQGNLNGTWKYTFPGGEMTMQINATTIVIDGASYPFKTENNTLQVYDGYSYTGYPYSLNGNQLTLVFPDGNTILFTRDSQGAKQGPLSIPPSAENHASTSSPSLTGKWIYRSTGGDVELEFVSGSQLVFNGQSTSYQLKQGIIQAMGDYGWIDYPYTITQGQLVITFPDGTQVPFTRASTPAVSQGDGRQPSGSGSAWQLQGSYCYWSGSSGSYSSYSRTEKISFDGNGNFIYGSEGSFSSDAGMAYSGDPNKDRGTYRIESGIVYLRFPSGETITVEIALRENDGRITALKYQGKLYSPSLCE